tara:strand:+ start:1068 stop:1592 length:525 start_codon:yes stop_codon:yes gene_type:complete
MAKSKCPYTNFKSKVLDYIGILRTPREEYGGMPACPFVGPEIDKGKLMIDKFDPNESTLLDKIKEFDALYEGHKYDSALFVQVSDEVLSKFDTVGYQDFINRTMKENGLGRYKCICFNPNDEVDIDGFNARGHAPYFLINIATREALNKAHKTLAKTKYYDNMNQKYLKYLHKD